MADNGELLNEAEVEFLLAAAGEGEPTTSAPAPVGAEGQTVTMRGDLEQINLADIFQTLAMAKMEGVLRVRNPLEERQIYCHDGYVRIQVPPRLATRRLGQRLVQAGLLTADQLRQTLIAQRKEKKPIGVMLIQAGLLTQEQIDGIVGIQVGEDLFALFTWRHGQFEFFKGPLVDDAQRAAFEACPEFETNSLLLEVARRSDEWQSILEAIGNLDEIPARIADPSDDGELDEAYLALLNGADGRATYRELADHTTLGLFEVARAARDLVRGGLLANVDDETMVAAATQTAEAGHGKRAILILQTLRDRPGDRSIEVLASMATALEAAGERRQAGHLLLEAAQRQSEPETALQLARRARDLSPYDPGTLSFLRTVLLAHEPGDSPELEKCTIELLDALIDADLVPTALEICADARATGSLRPQILMRESRARQKARDPVGAADALFELGQTYDALGEQKHALEAYEALLRLDRSRKDVAKLLHLRRQTKLGRIVRLVATIAAVAMLGAMGVVFWQQQQLNRGLTEADQEITELLAAGDRAAARQRLASIRERLGDHETIEDLRNRIAFAEASEQGRLQRLHRARVNEQLTKAAQLLSQGNLQSALQTYHQLWLDDVVRAEVAEVVASRMDVIVGELESIGKSLPNRLPPPPDTLFDRKVLLTNLADLQSVCSPTQLTTFLELRELVAAGSFPEFLGRERVVRLQALVESATPVFADAQRIAQAYADALQQNEQQRRLDPMFKAAVEREAAFDFVAALALYRELEKQPAGDNDLRGHFRDQVARNATIVKFLDAVRAATTAGDFATAQQQLRALRASFPEVPFDRLVQLPLRVESYPRGATVLCNGKELGKTPLLVARNPADETRIELQFPGFRAATAIVRGDEVGTWTGHLLLQPTRTWKHGAEVEVPATRIGDHALMVDRGGAVTKLDLATGESLWTFRSGDLSGLLTQPIVAGDTVVVASLDGDLRGLSLASGTVQWTVPKLPTEASPELVGNSLLLATTARELCVVDLASREVRRRELGEAVHTSPLVFGSTVVVVGERGSVVAYTLPSLEPTWTRQVNGLAPAPARLVRNTVVLLEETGAALALDLATGERRWRRALGQEPLGVLAFGERSLVVSTRTRQHYLDAATGETLREFSLAEGEWTAGALTSGERLLAPLRDGGIDVLDLGTGASLYRLDAVKRARPQACGTGVLVPGSDRTMQWFDRLP